MDRKVMMVNTRKLISSLFLSCIGALILYHDLVIGGLIIILFFACFSQLLKDFYAIGRICIFNGKNQFLLYYFLIHGIGFYTYLLRCNLLLNNYKFEDSIIIVGLLYAILGIIVFQVCYKYAYGLVRLGSFNPCRVSVKRVYSSPTYKWVLLICGIGIFTLIFWKLIGAVPMLIPNYNSSARAELGKGLGYLEALNFSLINLSLLLFIKVAKKRDFNFDSVVVLSFIVAIFILNSDRGNLLYYILALWFIYSIYKGQPSLKMFSGMALLLVSMAGLLGVLKSTDKSNILLSGTIILTEVAVEFDNYNEVFDMVKKDGFCGGSTLVPIFTLPIPRSLLPDKDKYHTAGNYFKEYHNHNHIRVGERISFIGEFYLNFGFPGIIIGMAFIGCFLGYLDKSVNLQSIISVYLYIQMVIMSSSVGGDIPTAFMTFIMRNFLLIVTLILIYIYTSVDKNAIYRHYVS